MAEAEFDLRNAFLLRQEQLLATLGLGRSVGSHPVVIGDDSELNWRGMLEAILPTRYRVSKGLVVDAKGCRSEQIDLLIYDRHFSPILLDVGDYVFVPAEAVYAAFEVKQEMTRDTILYAAKKMASLRKLERTSAPVPFVTGPIGPKPLHDILGGLLAMDTPWKPPFGEPFQRALEDAAADAPISLGCALRSGAFEIDPSGASTTAEADTTLIFFVLRLLKRLQKMASVPAIDYDKYAQVLGGNESARVEE